jgi:hypothetical protein
MLLTEHNAGLCYGGTNLSGLDGAYAAAFVMRQVGQRIALPLQRLTSHRSHTSTKLKTYCSTPTGLSRIFSRRAGSSVSHGPTPSACRPFTRWPSLSTGHCSSLTNSPSAAFSAARHNWRWTALTCGEHLTTLHNQASSMPFSSQTSTSAVTPRPYLLVPSAPPSHTSHVACLRPKCSNSVHDRRRQRCRCLSLPLF